MAICSQKIRQEAKVQPLYIELFEEMQLKP